MAEDTGTLTFEVTGAGMPGMEKKFSDMAIYHMLEDAKEAGEPLRLVGRNVFRPDQARPSIDEIDVKRSLVVDLVRKRW